MHFYLGKQPSAELMFSFLCVEVARKRKFGNMKLNTYIRGLNRGNIKGGVIM